MLQKQYAMLGISASHHSAQNYLLNKRVFFGLSSIFCLIISQFMYAIRLAVDFMEYMECICWILADYLAIICFVAIIWRKTTLFKLIDNTEKFIDSSKTSETHLKVFESIFIILF